MSDFLDISESLGHNQADAEFTANVISTQEEIDVKILFLSSLMRQNCEKNQIQKMKSSFMKSLKKDPKFWNIHYYDAYIDYKIKMTKFNEVTLMNQANNQSISLLNPPLLPEALRNFDYESLLFKIKIIHNFIQNNPNWIPFIFDLREVNRFHYIYITRRFRSI